MAAGIVCYLLSTRLQLTGVERTWFAFQMPISFRFCNCFFPFSISVNQLSSK